MSYLRYLFQPEDSTPGLAEDVNHKIPWPVRTAKTALWVGVSMILSVGISQLG